MRRRDAIKTLGAAAGASLMAPPIPAANAQSTRPAQGRRLEYVGWQVGLTYQTPGPAGLDRDYLMRLLDEMAQHRMNLLSLMMISYGYFDPQHDGYPWPVRNPKLECYRDRNATNADPSKEFVRKIIAEAEQRKIGVNLFMNWGIWNNERIRRSYPSASLQIIRANRPAGWLHCPDSPDAWQLGLDEVADLLDCYDLPNVRSYALERISYAGGSACYCDHTRRAFRQDVGIDIRKASTDRINAWKDARIAAYLKRYVEHVRKKRPNLPVWLHTQCAPGWGHDPAMLKQCGIDTLLPHVIQFPETKESLHRTWRRLAPNKLVLHFCCRDRRPANYKLWIKTPEIIAQAVDWTLAYPGDNLAGLLFFNETATSPANKQAVYEQIKRFEWS
ncbi:MAG: hypothetical protein JXQ73_27955 [Phycisphaerae bacterium]|nr:hypothetical protein [Phycisphaerae bacterium]